MPGSKRKTIARFFLVIVILIFDQLTKYIVTQKISLGDSIPVIKNIFHLTYILNRGAAFGIFKNQLNFLIFIAIVAIIFILINLHNKRSKACGIALCLIMGGAISNLIDRLRVGAVIDFLDFRIWPVFNIADSAITIGAMLLAYALLFKKQINGV